MDAAEIPVNLVSDAHCLIAYHSGDQRVAIDASWKQVYNLGSVEPVHLSDAIPVNHRHRLLVAFPIDYHQYVTQGISPSTADIWRLSTLHDVHIITAERIRVCFYCALSIDAPHVKFTEVQEMYLSACAHSDINKYWSQYAQKFYDEMSCSCPLKPAKFS